MFCYRLEIDLEIGSKGKISFGWKYINNGIFYFCFRERFVKNYFRKLCKVCSRFLGL